MANWDGLDRTNYFRVKDRDAFLAFNARCSGVTLCWQGDELAEPSAVPPPEATAFAFYADDGEGWPSYDSEGEEMEPDFVSQLIEHVADDDVIVFVSAGYEKARYATGVASAYHKGECVQISINDIYAKAKEAFGIEPTTAEY